MIERVERVTKIKPITNEVGHRFNSGYGDNKNGKFASELRRVINKKSSNATSSEIPDAYDLEVNTANIPLFYFGSLDLEALLR